MRNFATIFVLLMLQACASESSKENLYTHELPEVLTLKLPATTSGSLTQSLEDGLNESLSDLEQLLNRLRKSQQPTGPAATTH